MQLSGKPLALPSRDGEAAAAQADSNGHANGTNGSHGTNGTNGTHATAQTLEAEAARRTGILAWAGASRVSGNETWQVFQFKAISCNL